MQTLNVAEIREVSGGSLVSHPIVEYGLLFGCAGVVVNILTHSATMEIGLRGFGIGAAVGAALGVVRSL
jgi:hypothetical protein